MTETGQIRPNSSESVPEALELEQALLGAIMLDNRVIETVGDLIHAEYFADPLHRKLYETCDSLITRGQVASAIALTSYFESDDEFQAIGGARKYLAGLCAASASAFDPKGIAAVIRFAAIRRRLIRVSKDAMQRALTPAPDDTGESQVDAIERELFDIAVGRGETGFEAFGAVLKRTMITIEAAHRRDGGMVGISTGFKSIDKQLGGLNKGDVIVLASRPSMGKTSLATNIAFNVARAHRVETDAEGNSVTIGGGVVGFFSLEMDADAIMTRMVAEDSTVPLQSLRRGKLTALEFDRVLSSVATLEGAPLFIDDTATHTINSLRTRARRLKRTHGLDLLVIDYLQLLSAPQKHDGRVQEIGVITRGLKAIAKDLDVPLIALSQLSRNVEGRSDKRPLLSDLRESGAIEQDADIVAFIFREEYYLERGDDADRAKVESVRGKAELHIAKFRNGPTGIVHLRFDGTTTKFSDHETDAEPEQERIL